jgi:hypothetical protein
MTQTFRLHRRTAAYLGLACLAIGVVAAYLSARVESVTLVFVSIVAFLGSVFFPGPVLRNQTVEVRDESLIVRTFWHAVELRPRHLTEVVRHKGGARSYLFESGDLFYQITSVAYHNAEAFQREFDRLFAAGEPGGAIGESGRRNNGIKDITAHRGKS